MDLVDNIDKEKTQIIIGDLVAHNTRTKDPFYNVFSATIFLN